jgi:hypothetical protein
MRSIITASAAGSTASRSCVTLHPSAASDAGAIPGGPTHTTRAPSVVIPAIPDRATRELATSPTIATVKPERSKSANRPCASASV